jgi:hypothetical protein
MAEETAGASAPSHSELLAEALDLMMDFKTQEEACKHASRADGSGTGVDRSVFGKRLAQAMRGRDGARVPLTEQERAFHEEWSAQDCVDSLREVQRRFPHVFITRTFYRNETEIADSTWNRYFGTFLEFKRQARLQFSRFAHRLELNIARHASVDRMREVNEHKNDWEGAYKRPHGGRWQTAVIASDQHDIRMDPFYRRTLLSTIARAQPEKVVLGGDLFDLPDFSKHTKDPRDFRLVEGIHAVHSFLGDIRAAAPETEITLTEGNHEYRLLRMLAEQNPGFMVLLAELHGWTVPKLLGLDLFQVNFIARADLTAFNDRDVKIQLRKNYEIFWRCLLVGHYPDMRNMGLPGCSGHHHSHEMWSGYSPLYGPMEWHQLGCGHVREASYAPGEKWGNGFMLAHVDTLKQRTQFEYVDVSHQSAMIGGRMYTRGHDEPVLDLLQDAPQGAAPQD